MFRTNHPCSLCDYYSHCFPRLDKFCDYLQVLRDFEATHSGSSTPIPMDFGTTSTTEHGLFNPTIMITPPDADMTNTIAHILYLSSSLISLQKNLSEISTCTSIEPPSLETHVSTSVDFPSTSSSSTISDDEYVNLLSQDDAPGTAAASCSHYSSRPPIFHYDEDIMEAMNTPDYPWDDMHHRAYFLPYL